MSFRIVMITNQSYLQVHNKQLQISQGIEKYTIPLEDIACIILDNYAISLSANLLSRCADYNVAVISCDDSHVPNGIFHSYLPHSRQSMVINKQINLSEPFKKRIWQTIIKQKITNQAMCLQQTNQKLIADKLFNMASKVSSGDKSNLEAQASRIYFPNLFGKEFTRLTKTDHYKIIENDYQDINASLNYTYTILRSLICRYIVGYGLLPSLGVFHCNQLNAFNLADDLIEALRPYVDWYIYSKIVSLKTNNLATEYKPELVNILNHLIHIDDKTTTVLNACDIMLKSYISCINHNNCNLLKLPKIPDIIEISNMD